MPLGIPYFELASNEKMPAVDKGTKDVHSARCIAGHQTGGDLDMGDVRYVSVIYHRTNKEQKPTMLSALLD